VALLEFLAAAAGTRVVAPDLLHGVAHRRLRLVVMMLAVRAVNVTGSTVDMFMGVVVLTIRAVDVRLSHGAIP